VDAEIEHVAAYPSGAGVTLTFLDTGEGYTLNPASTPFTWLTGDVASNYEIRATILTGTFTSGTVGSWVPFSQSWTVSRSSLGRKACTALFEIRSAAGGPAITNKTITLRATVETDA
jgi:hypothetical protein